MRRTIVLAALAGALLQPGGLRAQESDNAGLMLGLHAVPMGLAGVGEEVFEEDGMGLGATIGYGFTDRFGLYGTVDVGYIEYDRDNPAAVGEDYQSLTLDLGTRVNLGYEFQRMRPFINAAISAVVTTEDAEEDGGSAITSGGGLTVGGGLQYFYRERWALLLAIQATMGAFTETQFSERTELFTEGVPYSHYRVQLGVTWHR